MSISKDDEGNIYIDTDPDDDWSGEDAAERGDAIDDDDSSSSSSSSSSSGGSSSSSSDPSDPDNAKHVIVSGGGSSGEPQTVVGTGDTKEEAETDAATNQNFDAAEGTDIDNIEEQLNSDPSRVDKAVTVTGGAGSKKEQTVVGSGSSGFQSEARAARNPGFDAAQGTRVDALETIQERGQGDNTSVRDAYAREKKEQREQTTQETSTGNANTNDQSPDIGLIQPERFVDNPEVINDYGNRYGAQRVLTPEAARDQMNTEARFETGTNVLAAPVEQNEETFLANREYASGTDVAGTSYLTQNLPVQDRFADYDAGQVGLDTQESVSNFLDKDYISENTRDNLAYATGLTSTLATQTAEGIVNFPETAKFAVNNPEEFGESVEKGLSRSAAGSTGKAQTASEFEAEAGQIGFALSALSVPATGGATGGASFVDDVPQAVRVSSVTDDAGATTAAARATGIPDAARATRKASSNIQDRIVRTQKAPDETENFAGQLIGNEDSDAFTDPSELGTSGSTSTSRSEARSFYGESFEPETASLSQIIKGDTPRSTGDDVIVLNPENIEAVDSLTLQPRGGTEDVTPQLSRREALSQNIQRRFESSRQDAQFEVQGLTEDSNGILKTRKGSSGQILKRPETEVETGVDTPDTTRRRISRDDRRQDVAEEQISFNRDSDLDRPENPSLRENSPDVDEFGSIARPVSISEQETGQESFFGQTQDQQLGQDQLREQETGQEFEQLQETFPQQQQDTENTTDFPQGEIFKELPEQEETFEQLRNTNEALSQRSDNIENRKERDEENQGVFEDLFSTEQSQEVTSSVGAELLEITGAKPTSQEAQNPFNLRPEF